MGKSARDEGMGGGGLEMGVIWVMVQLEMGFKISIYLEYDSAMIFQLNAIAIDQCQHSAIIHYRSHIVQI